MRQGPAGASGKTASGPAVVVAARRAPAEAGAAMLRAGGNAFDAVVAAGFVEAVVSPASCGIGGYGASGVAFLARGARLVAIDANAVAPAAATPGMFPTIPGRDPNAYTLPDARHKTGPLSVAVPGVLGGLLTMLERFGKLERKTVMAPAIAAARAGVGLTGGQALTWLTMEAVAEGRPAPRRSEVPAIVPMPALAETLEAIAAEGASIFYTGRIGKAIAGHVAGLGGILTGEDMAGYKPMVLVPLTVTVRGHVLATPPPGAGGLTSLQMVALFDRLVQAGKADASGGDREFEAWLAIDKVVWTERLTRLGDPAFVRQDPARLLAPEHLDRLLDQVNRGLEHPDRGHLIAPDPLRGTVHLAAADAEGNLVSWTQTHGGGFGSGLMVRGTGIVLGHGMCRFEPRTGWANSVAPGKRPLHNMCPLIAVKDGKATLAVGGAGARTIVNNVAAVAARTIVGGHDAASALAAPRVQCESLEPAVLERAAGVTVLEALRRRGHEMKETNRDAGTVHAIARRSGQGDWTGAAEPRVATSTTVVA